MAHDEALAARIRAHVPTGAALTERRMFGGLAFLVNGHMAVAASGQGGLLVRVDPDESEALVASTGAEPMVMRGRPMAGWLRVAGGELESEQELAAWVLRGLTFAGSLPPKHT